jgi:hypothetical protein
VRRLSVSWFNDPLPFGSRLQNQGRNRRCGLRLGFGGLYEIAGNSMHNRPRKRLNMYAVAMRLSMRGEYGGFHKRPLGVEFLEMRKI